MEMKIVKKDKNELQIEIDDLTLCELLRNELWDDKSVTLASYSRKHPEENPVLRVISEGKTPKKALSDAVKRLLKKSGELGKTFKTIK